MSDSQTALEQLRKVYSDFVARSTANRSFAIGISTHPHSLKEDKSMTNWSIRGNAAKIQTRLQSKSARLRVLSALSAALLVIGPAASSANAEDITMAQLRGKWQAALLWSSSGCGAMSGLLNFTFGLNGTTSTATLTTNSSCGPSNSTQSFTIQSLNPNGSGTAGLTCGEGCGWGFNIQVAPNLQIFNLVDIANGSNYVAGTAIRQ
jgi:hypothetical protein